MDVVNLLASNNYIIFNKDFAKNYGIEEAILLGALCSYQRSFNEDFYRAQESIIEDTALSTYSLRTATKNLQDLKIITFTKKGMPAKNHYRVISDNLLKCLTTRKEDYLEYINYRDCESIKSRDNEFVNSSPNEFGMTDNIKDSYSSNITDLYIISDDSLESEESIGEAEVVSEESPQTLKLFTKNKKQNNELKTYLSSDIFNKSKKGNTQKTESISNHLKLKVMQLNESKEVKEALCVWLDVLKQNKKAMSYEQLVIAVSELDRATNDDAVKVEAIKKATLRVYRSFEWTIDDAKKTLHKEITHLHNGSTTPTKTLEELTKRTEENWNTENIDLEKIPEVY